MVDKPKAKPSALKKKVVDDAPITISKGKRGATKWRKGNGPWRYDEPPQQHKPKVVTPPKKPAAKEAPTPKLAGASKLKASGGVRYDKVIGVPAGTDIRTHLKDSSAGLPGHAAVKKAIEAIAAVHGNGGLSAKINIDCAPLPSGLEGRYHGKYVPVVYLSPRAKEPTLTVIHELGHAIDDRGPWGDGKRLTGGPANSESGVNPAQGSPWHPAHKAVQGAIESSKAVTALRNKRKEEDLYVGDEQYLAYQLQPNELWARAYTQYIASKQPTRALLEQLLEHDHAREYKRQWSEEDFKPIEAAIDQVIRGAGWRK